MTCNSFGWRRNDAPVGRSGFDLCGRLITMMCCSLSPGFEVSFPLPTATCDWKSSVHDFMTIQKPVRRASFLSSVVDPDVLLLVSVVWLNFLCAWTLYIWRCKLSESLSLVLTTFICALLYKLCFLYLLCVGGQKWLVAGLFFSGCWLAVRVCRSFYCWEVWKVSHKAALTYRI